MATIIQKPDTLSLSRNLKELIISTSSEISLQLLKEDSLLLEETYLPDVNNRVHVDLADIVTSALSLTMPSGEAVSTSQGSIYSDFTVKVDGSSVAEFTAVRSGVERFSDTAANFLTANWLTWQPQVKEVLRDQPEWLTYYPASGSCACYAKFYYTDGTSGELKVCDITQCASVNTRFSKLWGLDESGKERYGIIDVYIKNAQGLRLTYVQRYILRSQEALDEVYLCENSLGGIDTFRFYGDRKLMPEIGHTALLFDNAYTAADPDLSRKWSQNTGMLRDKECEWCWELFRSSAVYHLYKGGILPIVLDSSSIEKSAMSVLAAYSFDYRYASDFGLLNISRSENLPDMVEISGPDAEVFFLTPRLNEFPSAILSDDLIFPVQSPYEESWYILSLGGIKSSLLGLVEEIYGPMWHVHDNLQLLNLFSIDDYGRLLWNKEPIGAGGAHTDHAGELIRPAVIAVPSAPPSADEFGLLDTEYYFYFDETSAVDGEVPTAAGGDLDIEGLWQELGTDTDTKRISHDHLPEDVVCTASLDKYYTKTDADKKFVTLATEQTITGRKTYCADAVFGGNGSKLFVPSTEGAGLYYFYFDSTSAVDGETPTASGGGLDVDELWAELGGSSSYKVIASSHIPDLYVKNTGDTMTGDYTGFTRLISGYGTDSRRTKITSGNFSLLAATANWAGGVSAYTNDGSTLLSSLVGAYGESDNLKYIYMGGEYNNHILHIDLASKNVGIGTSNPGYRLHVVDYIYADRIRTAIPSKTWNNTNILADGGFNNDLYNAVDHNTCQTVLSWHNVVNGYGYRTRYSIASIRKTNGGWGHLRLSVGNSDDGSSVGALLDINPHEGVYAYPSFYVNGKLYVPSSEGNNKYYIRFE